MHLKKESTHWTIHMREDYIAYRDALNRTVTTVAIIVSVITFVLGVILPFAFTLLNRKDNKKIKEEVDSIVKNKLETCTEILNAKLDGFKSLINKQMESMQENEKQAKKMLSIVRKSQHLAEQSANKAKVSELFTKAVKEKDVDEQIRLYSEILEINPYHVESLNNRGLAYKNKQDYNAALSDFAKAIDITPNDHEIYLNKGNVYHDMNRFDSALNCYEHALSIKSDYAKAHHNIGLLHFDNKDYQAAINSYSKAIDIDSDDANSYGNRAYAYYKLGKNLEQALKDVNIALSHEKDPNFYDTRACIYSSLGSYEESLKDHEKAIQALLDNPELFENRAATYKRMAENERNIEKKNKYIKLAKADLAKAKELKRP